MFSLESRRGKEETRENLRVTKTELVPGFPGLHQLLKLGREVLNVLPDPGHAGTGFLTAGVHNCMTGKRSQLHT